MQAQTSHFLYNTLDTIVWLSEAKELALSRLQGIVRLFQSHSKRKGMDNAEEEIDHIRNYLIIQK